MNELDARSLSRLNGVHPDLAAIVKLAARDASFIVTEGVRTKERQLELFLAKKSQTMNSRHLTGHAVDLAIWADTNADKVVGVNELSWKFQHYQELADFVKKAAQELGVAIVWGGDWVSFKDGPHFELDRKVYN